MLASIIGNQLVLSSVGPGSRLFHVDGQFGMGVGELFHGHLTVWQHGRQFGNLSFGELNPGVGRFHKVLDSSQLK